MTDVTNLAADAAAPPGQVIGEVRVSASAKVVKATDILAALRTLAESRRHPDNVVPVWPFEILAVLDGDLTAGGLL